MFNTVALATVKSLLFVRAFQKEDSMTLGRKESDAALNALLGYAPVAPDQKVDPAPRSKAHTDG